MSSINDITLEGGRGVQTSVTDTSAKLSPVCPAK